MTLLIVWISLRSSQNKDKIFGLSIPLSGVRSKVPRCLTIGAWTDRRF